MDSEASIRPQGTPIGILVVALATTVRVALIVAALLWAYGVIDGDWLAGLAPIPVYDPGTDIGLISRGMLIAMLVASVLSIWGLLRRHEWGWTLSIVTAGLILALGIGWWAAGEPHYVSMLANSIAVFYLNQRDVRAAFHVGRP